MVCRKCGFNIPDGKIVCPHCGANSVEMLYGNDSSAHIGNNNQVYPKRNNNSNNTSRQKINNPFEHQRQNRDYYSPNTQLDSSRNGAAIVGLIFSIAGFGFPLFGLIFSIVGLKKSQNMHGNGKKLASAGLIISIIGFLYFFIRLI